MTIDILALIERDTKLTRKSYNSRYGAEWKGRCPLPGCNSTNDALRVVPDYEGGKWNCRKCSPTEHLQSAADYLMRRDGISFVEAQEQLGLRQPKGVTKAKLHEDPQQYPTNHGCSWANYAKWGAALVPWIDTRPNRPTTGQTFEAILFNDATGGRFRIFNHPDLKFIPVQTNQAPVLYGLSEAVQLANQTGQRTLYLVNGQPSVIACHAHGIPAFAVPGGEGNVAGFLRKGLLPHLIAHWAGPIRVCFDGDKQGYKSAPGVVDELAAAGYIDVQALDLGTGYDAADVCVQNNGTSQQAFQNLPVFYPLPASTTVAVSPSQERELEHCTDLGNARRFVQQHGSNLHYVGAWGCWIVWDGKRWQKDDTGAVQRLARETVGRIYTEAAAVTDQKERRELGAWALASESKTRLDAMVALAQDEPGIHIRHDELDANPWLLNVANGTVDLHSGKLLPHDRNNLQTKLIDVAYDPQATAPLWESFMQRVLGCDTDLIAFVQRAVGYSLTGNVDEQCIFFMHGSGKNGKSTFSETIKALLGSYAQKAPTDMLMTRQNGGGIPNDIARLPGARFVVAAEIEEGRRLAESLIKDLAGGDTLIARFMRQEFFEFQPTHKLWLYGNHKPVIRGTDTGIWRRIRLIPFIVQIPVNERDLQFKSKLLAELPGVLAWAVRGCLDWQRNGLGMPQAVEQATASYRIEMDVVGSFIDDCCLIGSQFSATAADLYTEYQRWCDDSGETGVNQRRFGMQLSERGFERYRSNGRKCWRGIGLVLTPSSPHNNSAPSAPSAPKSGMNEAPTTHEAIYQNQGHLGHLGHSESSVHDWSPVERAQGKHLPTIFPFAAVNHAGGSDLFVIVVGAQGEAKDTVTIAPGDERSTLVRFYATQGSAGGTRADHLEYIGPADELAMARAKEEAAAADRATQFAQQVQEQRQAMRDTSTQKPGRPLRNPSVEQLRARQVREQELQEAAFAAASLGGEDEPLFPDE